MSKVGSWSTTAGSNNATPPDGWPEGQAPSTVNDCAREMMAAIRTALQDLQFIDQGLAPTYVSASQFSVAGNQTSAIHAGRRLKLFDATTVWATVVTASFAAVTNVLITADAAGLTGSLSSFAIAILSVDHPSQPPTSVTSTNALILSPTINAASMSGGSVDGYSIGYKVVPQTGAVSGTYAFTAGDIGAHVLHALSDTTGRTWTIPTSASISAVLGSPLTVINPHSAGTLTIALAGGTMYLAGVGSTGNRTLQPNGIAVVIKYAADEWIISGTGLT